VKSIIFSQHALEQIPDRGATREEVIICITEGEVAPAKSGRKAFRRNFPFGNKWKGRYYEIKQVMPIVVEDADRMIVVTVYVFYFGGK
jgi:hypothetical protein